MATRMLITVISSRDKQPVRGEIWRVNFNPSVGEEIQKLRPALVMNISANWNLRLLIVVPLTKWQKRFAQERFFWMIKLPKDKGNKLQFDSAANTFQVKSISTNRLHEKLGVITEPQLDLIAETVGYCIGYTA